MQPHPSTACFNEPEEKGAVGFAVLSLIMALKWVQHQRNDQLEFCCTPPPPVVGVSTVMKRERQPNGSLSKAFQAPIAQSIAAAQPTSKAAPTSHGATAYRPTEASCTSARSAPLVNCLAMLRRTRRVFEEKAGGGSGRLKSAARLLS